MLNMISPYKGGKFRITSRYGTRTLNGKTEEHGGIDVVGISSKEVCAVAPGVVVASRIVTDKSNLTWQWGNYVAVRGDDGKTVYYCHMKERKAVVGQRVDIGDDIGIEGNTGYSFGAHLHLEIREGNKRINAAEYIGVPNEIGIYETEVEDEMNEKFDELYASAGEIYNKLEDVPKWARPTIEKLMAVDIIKGDTKGNLKLSYQMLRMLVILDRSGVFG